MGITWKDEPYFENLEKVTLITETGDEIDEKVKTDGSNAEVDIELNEFFDRNENMILKPELCFDGDVRVKLENNYNRPVVSNRETMSFSRIAKIAPNNYKRVWGNLVGKAYAIGITENVNLLKTLGLWLYEDTRLCIKLDWLDEDIKAYCLGANFKVLLRDKVSNETIQMVREQNVSDEYIFYVELENLKKKNYLVCVVLDNGMVSYVEMSDGGFALKSSTTKK